MDTSEKFNELNVHLKVLIITSLVVIHLLGIILFISNGIYLKISRGYDSARISMKRFTKRERKHTNPKSTRRCKILPATAYNMLFLYQAILMGFDIILAFLFTFQEKWNYHFNKYYDVSNALWITAASNCALIVLYILDIFGFNRDATKAYAELGNIHCRDIFEFMCFLLFWMSFLLMLVCLGLDCSVLKPPLKDLASGQATISLAIAVVLLFLCSVCCRSSGGLQGKDIKTISKPEAVAILTEKRKNIPYIDWKISCGHKDGDNFVKTHVETRTYKFTGNPNYFCKMDIPLEIPSEKMFQRKVTKLVICTSSRPGDKDVQKEMILDRERFSEEHKGHDEQLFLTTENRFVETYFVSDDQSAVFCITLFSCLISVILCCFLLPYKWFLFCTMGRIKYKIDKRVYSVQEPGTIQISQLVDTVSMERF